MRVGVAVGGLSAPQPHGGALLGGAGCLQSTHGAVLTRRNPPQRSCQSRGLVSLHTRGAGKPPTAKF